MNCRTQNAARRVLAVIAVLGAASVAAGQEPRLLQWGRANGNFGMDDSTFRRIFGPLFRERPAATLPSSSLVQLADQVTDVRLFLTPQANVVIGEVQTRGRTSLREFTVNLEGGPIVFSDRGEAPDRQRGDGVFTARFRMNTADAWGVLRPSLGASAQALAQQGERQFLRRGPRDIVPLRQALDSLRTQAPATFRALSEGAERARLIATVPAPADAARRVQIDITRTAMLSLPIPGIEPLERFRLQRLFDFPVLPIFPPPPPPVVIDDARSLMIVHTGVVEDGGRTFEPCTGVGTKGGAWTFGHLMREMAHGTGMSPEDFTLHWLSSWIIAQEANGFIVNEPGRGSQLQARIIDSWQRLSGAALDIDQFPARLLAIVNRPDLADKIGYGVAGSAGEGRFVFGLVEKTTGGACNTLPFTVIFEYGIPGGSCPAVKAWHQRWKALDVNPLGSPAYDAALELITRDFTEHGSNPAQLPNQSALNQLRTNEIALAPLWQLREFRLQSSGAVPPGVLDLVTVKQTPDDGFRNGTIGTPTVAAYIVANETDILNGRHKVPERFPDILTPFMGAKSDVPFGTFWNAPGLTSPPMTDPAEARRIFSLGTCNGCHSGETNTSFTHVTPRNGGAPATLSGFLTGIDVTIPVTGGTHHYADLAERELAMTRILTTPCFLLLGVRRIPFVH